MTRCTDVTAAEEIANASAPAFRCAPCAPGYQGNGQMCSGALLASSHSFHRLITLFLSPSDINECLNRTVALPQICINRPGSFEIACTKGFLKENEECKDIDECVSGIAVCPRGAVCRNQPGNYSCECPSGKPRLVGLRVIVNFTLFLSCKCRFYLIGCPCGQREHFSLVD